MKTYFNKNINIFHRLLIVTIIIITTFSIFSPFCLKAQTTFDYSDSQVEPYRGSSNNPYDYYPASAGGDYQAQPHYEAPPPVNSPYSYTFAKQISYDYIDLFYERTFFEEDTLLADGNGLGLRLVKSITRGFFMDLGLNYTKFKAEDDATLEQIQAKYGSNRTQDDLDSYSLDVNLGLGFYFPVIDKLHLIGKGGVAYSKVDFETNDNTELLDGVGWYVGPEVRILASEKIEVDLDAIYKRIEDEGQLGLGAQVMFYPIKKIAIGAKYRILEEESRLGIGVRFDWD